MQNFWQKLKKPIMAIAPMANVTDAAFRRMFAECGAPDVFWTEFVSVEGLLSRLNLRRLKKARMFHFRHGRTPNQ